MKMINLRDKLNWDKLTKADLDTKKIAAIASICAVVLILDFAFLMKWQFGSIKNTSVKAVKLNGDLKKLKNDLAMIKGLKDRQAEGKGVAESKKLIPEDQMATLLQAISDAANKNGVKIIQMSPSKDSKSKGENVSFDTTKFVPLAITMDLICAYHSLGKFINDLENSQIFVSVEEIRIIRAPGDYLRQNVNLRLMTYVKK